MPGKTRKEALIFLNFLPAILATLFLFLDRVSKNCVLAQTFEGQSQPLIPNFLYLTHVHNRGAAFGILESSPLFLKIFAITAVLILSFLFIKDLVTKFKSKSLFCQAPSLGFYGWSFVACGALGNLYDRVYYGFVIDFIDFRFWPVFNVADILISVGVGIILLELFITQRKSA